MARYVLASRRAGRFRDTEKEAAREAFDIALESMPDVDVVADNDPPDPHARRVAVFDSGPGEVAALASCLPADVILEPEILHWTDTNRPAEFIEAERATMQGPVGTGLTVRVTVTGAGAPLPKANVILFLRGLGGLRREVAAATDAQGTVALQHSPFWVPAALVVVPAGGFWSVIERNVTGDDVLVCPPLPNDGPLGWWHHAFGIDRFSRTRGRSIRVGVIDTGTGPHPALSHVKSVGAFVEGEFDPAGGADVDAHGTHVAGIIGARPIEAGAYGGVAPGVHLLAARVFPPGEGANQADIANAIDYLSKDEQVDLINMSLGSPRASQIERDAIQDALERGTLCVCAAANSAGPVEFPAAFPETVAVSALGLLGWAPARSLAATRPPEDAARFGSDSLYLANFSCFGPELACAGPGVGIVSTVPARHGLVGPYASMDGTSMASPAVVGILARLLSRDVPYRALPRDQTRAETARSILIRACIDVDLAPVFQGAGVPREA